MFGSLWHTFSEGVSRIAGFLGDEKKDDSPAAPRRRLLRPPQQVAALSPRTPPSQGRKRSRKVFEADEDVRHSFSKENINVALHTYWFDAHATAQADGRTYLREDERKDLLHKCHVLLNDGDLSYDALKKRIQRIRKNGTPKRKAGSGRPTTFTPDIAEEAAIISRQHGGEISRSALFDLVKESLGKEKTCSRSVFLDHLRSRFKRRRIRLKPTLSERQKEIRKDFARYHVDTNFADQSRTIYVDEKRFEAVGPGYFNLPVQDTTPTRSVQSKGNIPFVMVLAAVMEPRGDYNGVVGMHSFTQTVAASRDSKNREAGTIIEKAENVSGPTYVEAWRKSILPELKARIEQGKIARPTRRTPLIMQDDNATPHRARLGGKVVTHIICDIAKDEFDIHMVPADPAQPAQSPDCNPLDTFMFRVLNIKFRRIRAVARVQFLASVREQRRAVQNVDADHADGEVADIDGLQNILENSDEDIDEPELALGRRRTIPLRCNPENPLKCPGCRKKVSNRAEATQCDLRQSWWHNACADYLCEMDHYKRSERVKEPSTVAADDPWVCPHCAVHLCLNVSTASKLCVVCSKPSMRTGAEAGRDMICCDRDGGGLFHKSCVRYDEVDEMESGRENWYCVACDSLLSDSEYVPMRELEDPVEISSSTVAALRMAVEKALGELELDFFVRGFETRKEILKKILDAEGSHDYDTHWRKPKN